MKCKVAVQISLLVLGAVCLLCMILGIGPSTQYVAYIQNIASTLPFGSLNFLSRQGGTPSGFTEDGNGTLTYRYLNPLGSIPPGRPIHISGDAAVVWRHYHEAPSLEEMDMESLRSLVDSEGRLFPQPVTASDQGYFKRLWEHLPNKISFFPHRKIIIVDLGLGTDQIENLTKTYGEKIQIWSKVDDLLPNEVDINPTWEEFPDHVFRHLRNYAWKIALIPTFLELYGAVFWMDSSVEFLENVDNYLEEFIRPTGALYPLSELAREEKVSSLREYIPEKGSCYFVPVELTSHSILTASNQTTLSYLPVPDYNQTLQEEMHQATSYVIYNTRACKEFFMKPAMACALESDCIGHRTDPWGPRKSWGPFLFNRCDQTINNILINNMFNFTVTRFQAAKPYPAVVLRTRK